MEFRGFFFAESVCRAAGVELGMPHGFAGIDVTYARDAGLVEEKFFQRATRCGEQGGEAERDEFLCKGIYAERVHAFAGFARFEIVDTAKVTAVSKTENTSVEFE